MTTHSSILAWKISWREESDGLQSMGVTKSWTRRSTHTKTHMHTEYSTIIILLRERYICLLEKEMTTHSSIFAWRIPWTGEPGGLQSMGSQRVGHYGMTNTQYLLILKIEWRHY